jgi:hypothetical protein
MEIIMAKAKYINLFINEKVYENETGAFYNVISGIKQTGKTPPPFLYNKKYTPKEDIVLKAGNDYDISLWFNERDGKKDSSIAIKPAVPYEKKESYQNDPGYQEAKQVVDGWE